MKKLFTIVLFSLFAVCSAQDTSKRVPFNGVVTDLLGNPIKGAKVYVVSSSFYAKTDKHGRFGLTNVQKTDTIHILFDKRMYLIPVETRRSIRIRLGDQMVKEANEDLELVDLGYGYVKRREQTTASNGITGEMLRRTGQTDLLAALSGLVPGLNISSNGFGGNTTAIIRGRNTIYASTDPLFIVDGVVVDNLRFVNIYDVDNVEVMKDASIYGSRGANGAIIVHTKRP